MDAFAGNVGHEGVVSLSGQLSAMSDAIVTDPPRAGVSAEMCKATIATGIPRIALVPCDPTVDVHDLRVFTEDGHQLGSLRAWDLFPHTHHAETVSVLSRQRILLCSCMREPHDVCVQASIARR